jgi:hypothetical protein
MHEHSFPTRRSSDLVKFVGSALVGFLVGLIGFYIGKRLPERCAVYLHAAAWVMMIAACGYLFGRETAEYILG